MLASGIQSPVPLEELEVHLREEISRRMEGGAVEREAFDAAVAAMGSATSLKAEFRKAGGFWVWLGEDRPARIHRTFALLWLAFCCWIFFNLVAALAATPFISNLRLTPDLYLIFFFAPIFLRGIIAAIRLFGGNRKEARILRVLAIIGFVFSVGQIIYRHMPVAIVVSYPDVLVLAFYGASLYLMRSPKKSVQN